MEERTIKISIEEYTKLLTEHIKLEIAEDRYKNHKYFTSTDIEEIFGWNEEDKNETL